MSLISRTPSDLFATLLSRENPKEIAVKFVQEHITDTINVNLQLIDLTIRCCGLTMIESVPSELVRNENVEAIVELFRLTNQCSGRNVINKECWNNALKFFESFWFHYWIEYADEEEMFFENLILTLSTSKDEQLPGTVRIFCNQVLSKFVTSILKNQYGPIPEQRMNMVLEQIHSVMVDSFCFKDRRILKANLQEFMQWLSLGPEELIHDNFLRYILWSLKEPTTEIILIGLELLQRLLSDQENLPEKFLEQCGLTFSVILQDDIVIQNDEIFARICECCVKIRLKFQYDLPDSIDRTLTENLYSIETDKMVAAADYWLALYHDANDNYQTLRNIIHYINSHTSLKYADYFTDSLIDKCPVLTNWSILAKLLAGKGEKKLTETEEDALLVIIVYAIELMVTKRKPNGRSDANTKIQIHSYLSEQMDDAEETRRCITHAFGPHMKSLFLAPNIDECLLLKLLTLLDFNSMPVDVIKMVVRSCRSSFQGVSINMRRMILELLNTVKTKCNNDMISRESLRAIRELKNEFETLVKNELDDFLFDPETFRDTEAGRKLENAFFTLRIIHVVEPVEKCIVYHAAVRIIKRNLPAQWHPTFMAVREMCIILSTSYVLEHLQASESLQLSDNVMKEALLLMCLFGSQLKTEFVGNRAGMVLFWSVCDILLRLKKKEALNNRILERVNTLNDLSEYFLIALAQPDSEKMNEIAMSKYLEMIDEHVMPMENAYDALNIHCQVDDVKYVRCLLQFLVKQCEERGVGLVAAWMTTLWIRIYEKSVETGESNEWKIYEKIRDLVYCINSKVEGFARECHIVGIDYATSEVKCVEFARVLSTFSPCLDTSSRLHVLNYALAKDYANTPTFQLYIRSLEKETKLKASVVLSPSSHTSVSQATSDDEMSVDIRGSSPIGSSDGVHFI